MPNEPRILQVFRDKVEIDYLDQGAVLDDDIDAILGFHGPLATAKRTAVPLGSWRAATANYTSVAELRLQELTSSMLVFHSEHWPATERPEADQVCVRIVNRDYGSPVTRREGEFYYIVLPWGYLKSLENVWRMHGLLCTGGQGMPALRDPCILTDKLGGASIERAIRRNFATASSALEQIIVDQLWHVAWGASPNSPEPGSYIYPEGLAKVFARLSAEVRGGMYSTEGLPAEKFRVGSTPQSRWMTRCALAYVVMHEMGHVLFRHENDGDQPDDDNATTELLCDMVATHYYSSFVRKDASNWQLAAQDDQEFVVGGFAFFTATEMWENAGVVLADASDKGGTDSHNADAASRLSDIQSRARDHFKYLRQTVGKDPALLGWVTRVACEMRSFVVAMQMVADRMTRKQHITFATHFNAWKAQWESSGPPPAR